MFKVGDKVILIRLDISYVASVTLTKSQVELINSGRLRKGTTAVLESVYNSPVYKLLEQE